VSLRIKSILVLCLSTLTWAQTPNSAETFVRGIYAEYAQSGPDVTGKKVDQYFTPAVVQLIRHDQASTPRGYVGRLDFDPFCSCQDPDGLKLIGLSITPVSEGKAIARTTLEISGNRIELHLTLAKVSGHWRVDNIAEEGKFDLREILRSK
jgi:Protein of unknown function (DUF3828)